ncbi:MAG: MarC family protein [Candidatus Altiarchaeota archaeon]|nr:MarC family protein [Candidatus Altiarchaeota archaeon]
MDFTFMIQAFVTLFLIVDPVVNIPIFVSLTERFPEKDRAYMIRKSVFIAGIVLVLFTFLGNVIFTVLGVDMYSFQIAGGLLLLIISFEMLFGRKTRTEMSDEVLTDARENVTVTPMAVPLLTGPGAITSGIMLFNLTQSYMDRFILLIVIVVVFILSYVVLSNSSILYRALGKTGTKVLVRLMGLMLSAIAVQFVITGLKVGLPVLG